MSNAAQYKTTQGAWPVVVCFGSMTCLAIAVNFAPVYLTTFSETFGGAAGLTEEQLGRIPAIIFAATVTGILATGRLADLWGGKLFTLLGLGLTAAGLCMLAAAGSYATLLAAGAVMGFGGGVLDMVLSPIVCAMRPNAKPRMLNWLHAFYCIGALGTVLAASAALRLHISWRALALGMNIVPVAMFIAFLPLRIPPLVHEDADRTPLAALVSRPFFLAVLLAITFCGATEQGMAQWLPAYAERSLGYTKAFGAMALAGFSIGMIIGRTLAGGLAHRFAPRPILLAGCAGCVACYAIACFFPERTVALAACIATGFAVSSLWPTMLGLASDRFPHGGASMFSLMAAGGNIGCFLMPWIIGILARYLPLPLSIASAALCPLFLAVILIAAKTRK